MSRLKRSSPRACASGETRLSIKPAGRAPCHRQSENDSVKINKELQETLLAFVIGREEGGAIVGMLSPDDFDRPFKQIAELVWPYWQKSGFPSRVHVGDLLADYFDKHRDPIGARVMVEDLLRLAPQLNPAFVLDQARTLQRNNVLKEMIFTNAEDYDGGRQDDIESRCLEAFAKLRRDRRVEKERNRVRLADVNQAPTLAGTAGTSNTVKAPRRGTVRRASSPAMPVANSSASAGRVNSAVRPAMVVRSCQLAGSVPRMRGLSMWKRLQPGPTTRSQRPR
jgi:hypothetical protein